MAPTDTCKDQLILCCHWKQSELHSHAWTKISWIADIQRKNYGINFYVKFLIFMILLTANKSAILVRALIALTTRNYRRIVKPSSPLRLSPTHLNLKTTEDLSTIQYWAYI
jgi:hypothetical protein